MELLARLQSAQSDTVDVSALQAALDAAAPHASERQLWRRRKTACKPRSLPRRLQMPRPLPRSAEEAGSSAAIELSVSEVNAATTDFAEARIIGEGGFGRVYMADAIAPGHVDEGTAVAFAVKRAHGDIDADDLRREIRAFCKQMSIHIYCRFVATASRDARCALCSH